MREAGDKLEAAFGHEATVRHRGGEIVVEIRFGDLDQALDLARTVKRVRR
jgi:hypothetical protein